MKWPGKSRGLPAILLALSMMAGAGCGIQSGDPSPAGDGMASFTAQSFDAEVGPGSGVVVVDFWAAWCGPCRRVTPILKQLSAEYTGRITFAKVNVDEQPALADRYQVRSIPCLILFRDGQALDALIGARSATEYRKWFDQFLTAAPAETKS